MKLKMKGLACLLLSTLTLSAPVFASIPQLTQLLAHGYFESIDAPGSNE